MTSNMISLVLDVALYQKRWNN